MASSRSAPKAWFAIASSSLLGFLAVAACSAKVEPAPGPTPGGNQGGSGSSAAGTNPGGGASATAGTTAGGQGGASSLGGNPGAGGTSAAAGNAGSVNGGTPGAGGSGGATGGSHAAGGTGGTGLEEGDTPPWQPLEITASLEEHQHGNAGMDARAKSLGKLAVDIGVNSGGYISWLAKRGYHSIGAPCGSCPAPNLGGGRDEVGDCRVEEFANTAASVKNTLTSLKNQFPEEGWGYFLNQDGSVRWSDVAITGISHGATTAAVAGRIVTRMWRVVSRAGPRDNTCGAGNGQCPVPLSTPAYDPACPDADVASWLDQPSKTPMNRFYALVGTTDGQCGDIMFNMKRTGYIGQPVLFNMPGAVLTGSNQFFSTEGGHYDFLRAPDGVPNTDAALNIAFAIPPENQNPDF